jgi:hypothetical protein
VLCTQQAPRGALPPYAEADERVKGSLTWMVQKRDLAAACFLPLRLPGGN